jgi:serine/threonine protein kinase
VKVTKPRNDANAIRVEVVAILREIMTHRYTAHPAVLPLRGWNFESVRMSFYLVIAFMEHGSVTSRLRTLTPTDQTIILYGSAVGIEYLHALEILHRDIKTDNILLDLENHPRIGDLGMAKMKVEQMQTAVMGTFAYIAPEVLNADRSREWTFSADVYAFAITWAAIVMGQEWKLPLPPGKPTFEKLQGLHRACHRPDITKLTIACAPLADLLRKMWDKSPEIRPKMPEVVKTLWNPECWIPGVDQ